MMNYEFLFWIVGAGAFLLALLYIVERKNQTQLQLLIRKRKIVDYYLQKIEDIKNSEETYEQKLEGIKSLSKKLFNEYYGLDINLTYSKLSEFFKSKGNNELEKFSEKMGSFYYLDKKPDKKCIRELINVLKEEAKNVHLTEEDLKEINRINSPEMRREAKRLVRETKRYIRKGDHKNAKKTYERLENFRVHKRFTKKIDKIFDSLMNLHLKHKRKQEKQNMKKKIKEEKLREKMKRKQEKLRKRTHKKQKKKAKENF